MFPSRYKSCPRCGASVARHEPHAHECDRERWLDYQIFHLRDELARFEAHLGAYLASARGRFESWYAERQRHRGKSSQQ